MLMKMTAAQGSLGSRVRRAPTQVKLGLGLGFGLRLESGLGLGFGLRLELELGLGLIGSRVRRAQQAMEAASKLAPLPRCTSRWSSRSSSGATLPPSPSDRMPRPRPRLDPGGGGGCTSERRWRHSRRLGGVP